MLLVEEEDNELVLNVCWVHGAYEASKYNCETDRWINGLDLKKKKKFGLVV